MKNTDTAMQGKLSRRALVRAAPALGLLGIAPGAWAQGAYPNRALRVIVPQPPGGGFDFVARLLAERLGKALGQSVVVENKTGSGTLVGTEAAAQAAPDGYTLLMGSVSNIALNMGLYSKLSYDSLRDFEPVGLAVSYSYTLVARKDLALNSLQDVVAYAKANPGRLSYASSGIGSTYHLGAELFRSQTGIEWTHVPYKGAAPAIQDVLAGHVQVMFDNTSSAIPNIKAGRVRALGVASLRRYPNLPELPTIAEQGLPGYETTIWLALFVPAKTPAASIENLHRAVQEAVDSAEYKERMTALDMQPRVSSSQELADYLKSDLAKWAKVVKDAGIKAE